MKLSRGFISRVILFFAVLTVYLVFPTKNYYWDGITFAQTIERANSLNASLLHPNHLIYEVCGYLIYHAALAVGIEARALTVLQVLNCVLSVSSTVLVFQIFKRSFRSDRIAAALSFLFAFSAMWWKFSTDADAYVPSILFVLGAFYFLHLSSKPRPVLVACLHAVGMCFHQLAVFFFPVALLGLYFQSGDLERSRRIGAILTYGACAFLITFGAYVLGFYLQTNRTDLTALSHWLTNYSPENGFVFNLKESFSYTLDGEFKLFFGGRFGFVKELPIFATVILLSLLTLAIANFIWQFVQLLRARTAVETFEPNENFRRLSWLCVIWIVSYVVFLFFWIPKNTFYRMYYLLPLLLLVAIFLFRTKWRSKAASAAYAFVFMVATANFTFYIYPYSQVRNETPLSLALSLNSVWTPRTVVYYSELNTDNQLVWYLNSSTTWRPLKIDTFRQLESDVASGDENGADVWVDNTAIKALQQDKILGKWLSYHRCNCQAYGLNTKAYYINFERLVP
jgi:hypothetical protein